MTDVIKDVHTEHCCAQHGCKYADSDCPVASGNKPQSYPCESCEWEKEDAAHATAAKDAEIEALRVRADAMAGEAIKHEARAERLAGLLDEVRSCFTRDDDLPSGLLPRIDAALQEHEQEEQSEQ